MNEPREHRQELDVDPAVEAALSPLRSIEPTAVARVRNRDAVAAALDELKQQKTVRKVPWWQRSISVPVPIAACALLLISLLVVAELQGKSELPKPVPAAEITSPSAPPADTPVENPPLVYRETSTYVCGIGELRSTRGYFFKEQNR